MDMQPRPDKLAMLMRRCRDALRPALLAQRGAVSIEAALVIPLMVFIIIGSFELYQYFRAASVLDRAAFTVANGVAMQRGLKDQGRCADTDDVCAYGAIMTDLMTPLNYRAHGRMVISLYVAEDKGKGAAWKNAPQWRRSYAGGSYGGAVTSRLTPPDGFPQPMTKPAVAGEVDSVVVVETFLDFEPFAISAAFWQALGGKRLLESRAFYRPRFADLSTLQ